MSFTNYLEDALLDFLFTDPDYTPPATLYIGLSETDPGETGSLTGEPTFTNGYARVSTAAADWNAASGGSKTTGVPKTFPQASGGSWRSGANLAYFFISDASTAGNMLCSGALTTAKPVLDGDTAEFAAGDLTLTLD
jgi:hypothetical protein